MSPGLGTWGSLEFLIEPTFVLRRSGNILNANRSAHRMLHMSPTGGNLFDHVVSSHQDLDAYLRRATGSTAPIVGGATLQTVDGTQRFRLHCAVLPEPAAERALVLRCQSVRDDAFAMLRRRVRDLDVQLRTRLREKAVLQEALRENEALLRELQHRVKNNVQMMHSLIQMSAEGAESEETLAVVQRARFRLQAMACAQDAIYRSEHLATVSAGPFLEGLVRNIARAFGAEANLRIEIEDTPLSSHLAHSLALILNELTTNAIKHGLPDRQSGTIWVRFESAGDNFHLIVHDSGPGHPAMAAPASGLKLVRGLCRQIDGSLDIAYGEGTKCLVRFEREG